MFRTRLGWVVLLAASVAHATVYDTFGYGPRAASMGGAMTAEAKDYTAVFYNPALLVDHKEVDFGLSFQFNRMLSDVVPKDLSHELCPGPDKTCAPADTVGYSMGVLFPLGGKVRNRVALGLGIYIPSLVLLRANSTDPGEPFWYQYQSNSERIVLHAALGIKLFNWLTLGLGVQALADLVGAGATIDVDLFNKRVISRSLDSYLDARMAPVVGLQIRPLERLRFGATYRGEIGLVYKTAAVVALEGVGTLGFTISGVTHYTPHSVTLGAAWDIIPELTVSVDFLEWQHWSAAPSPYMGVCIDLSGETLRALGLDQALDICPPTQKPGFADTFGARMGLEYRLGSRFSARVGGFYRPTPVPRQDTPGTNILDADTMGAAFGVGFNFPDPLEIFQSPITIDFAAQAQLLVAREARKEPTDTVPSYTYSGKVLGFTVAVRYDF